MITVGPDSDEREQRARELAEERGLVPVPPFDDPRIAAGQGTAALDSSRTPVPSTASTPR